MIEGVFFKELTTHNDSRGFFRELIRSTDDFMKPGFGQISHSLVNEGIIKGWHGHKYQTQWNYVITGLLTVVLIDQRAESPTVNQIVEFFAGEDQKPVVYSFPPGVLHGYKCLKGPMNILYVTSGVYDPGDEVRIDLKSKEIDYIFQ